MDRRQKKTRDAIFKAFTDLLAQKHYSQITVQEIIDAANIGRTTFYSHFETKDYLLRELCAELFGHIIDTAMGLPNEHYYRCCGTAEDSAFLHLLRHLQENDNNILQLLSSQSNEIFLRYFQNNLKNLIRVRYADRGLLKPTDLPEDFLVNHIASSFVETVAWWLDGGMKQSPEKLADWYLSVINPLLQNEPQER